ncbi:FACT complex subunit SSRP1-like [Tubulanus polymorphus]|uniref:FACT complex subunit SSRP1-like n=1 Tax=Tubulanus polymorphus TaxID=672921 RepID=UPI003DA45466
MGDYLEYSDVLQEVRGTMNPGRLKLQSSNVVFKNIKTGRVDQFVAADIDDVNWIVRARGFCLKFKLQNGSIHRYDGMKDTEFEKLSTFIRANYGATLEKKDVSVKGWNWGVADFIGTSVEFNVNKHLAFEVPLCNVSQSRVGKNEITLEFHQNDDAAVSLTELRFHIPPDPNAEKDPVEEFHENVLQKADIIQATGDALAIFSEIQCLTPRGRYDIKFYPTFIQLHGKTFDFKIPLTTILRLFLLPHKDGRQMFFVVSLDPPIKQGQTRYHFLILLFNKEEEITLELALTEEELQEKYEGKLTQEMSGPTFEIISRVMKAFVNRKITVPGSFVGNSGTHAISCSFKAATGHLYPLERGFIFVHKPPVHIRFDEIDHVNFSRSTGNTRSFDFDVETKAGTMYTFVSIEKDEYGKLFDFVSNKKLRVKNIGGKLPGSKQQVNYEEMESSGDENDHDAYLERMKAEGKERDDSDDDSSDDTFNPDNESGSSVAEEYDSDIQTTTGSSSDESESDDKKKKEKKKKEVKQKVKTVKEDRKPRKKKTKKDPDAPKRPQSAYFLWMAEMRETIKSDNPGISITDLSRKAGELWKEVTDKSEWEEKAKEEREKYQQAMDEYKKKKEVEGGDSDKSDDDEASSKKSSKKSASKKSPKKDTAGSGSQYKSKEFISTSESSGDEKKTAKKKKSKKAESEEEKPSKKKKKNSSAEESDSGPSELPSDHEEEVLSSPAKSSGSDSD